MSSERKHCIHVIAAKKFLQSFLKLPEEALRGDFDICYNNQCNSQNKSKIEYFGIPRKECEIPHEFVGIGLNTGENVPFEMKKVTKMKNPTNSNQIDKLLGDIGEPTYREVSIHQEDSRKLIREIFTLSHAVERDLRDNITHRSRLIASRPESEFNNNEDKYNLNSLEASNNSNRSKILNWFRDQKPIWDEGDYFVKSELFRSTPDWKRLETYKDLISCEWGSAKVLMIIQFWQTSLTFTDRLVNNRDSSIIEYVGGNEESCLPLRILIKFERKTLKDKDKPINETKTLHFEENLEMRQVKDAQISHETTKIRRKDPNKYSSTFESLSDNEILISKDETQTNQINIKYLEMVKYIQGKDNSKEFKLLENRFKDSDKSHCYLYIEDRKDLFLKLQTKYDKEIIHMIKTCIKGRKYDNENKLWLLPIDTIYESVRIVEFLGGTIDKNVLALLVNGNKTDLNHELMFSMDELDNWKNLLPKSSQGTWFRLSIKFHLSIIDEIYRGNTRNFKDHAFKLTFSKEGIDEHYHSELIKTLRNNNISMKWDTNEKSWRIPIYQFTKVISTCRGSLEFYFSSIFDHIVFKQAQEMIKNPNFQNKIKEYGLNQGLNNSIRKRLTVLESDEEEITRSSQRIRYDEDEENIELGRNEQALILSCLGKDDHDNKRLEAKILNMIRNMKTPKHIDKIEFILWPKHYKDWESISFLILSKDFIMNVYHPKLLLSIVSNVMIVSEGMIDYLGKKNSWPDNSFETRFELVKELPSLESRLYISEGIFCKTKLFIVGPPGNNHFKLCSRLATLGNASFVQDPLLADYIIICDESDPNALKIKKSVPKKQASKVQNTHGETHSIQVTPKWVYDVVLDFTIIKPTSKRNHKAWMTE